LQDRAILRLSADEIFVSIAQAVCFALAGVGSAVVGGVLIWADANFMTIAWQSAIIFTGAWLCFHLRPCRFGRDLIQAIGVAAGTFLCLAILVAELHGGVRRPNFMRTTGSVWIEPVGMLLISSAAGALWGRLIPSNLLAEIWKIRFIRLMGFVFALASASAALGAGIGFISGLAGQPGSSGYQADATVLGCLTGPFIVPLVYALIRPIEVSGGIAAFITLGVLVTGILSGAVMGPLAAAVAPVTAVLLAFGARTFETESLLRER
jgi:hypothetical protein